MTVEEFRKELEKLTLPKSALKRDEDGHFPGCHVFGCRITRCWRLP